eukprot:3956944-Pleurochrysis_carterae.AAC.1
MGRRFGWIRSRTPRGVLMRVRFGSHTYPTLSFRPGQDSHSALVHRTGAVPEHPSRRPSPTPVLFVRGVRPAGQKDPERSERVVDHEGGDGEVHVRPPPDERFFDDRGVPVVWKLLKPLYTEKRMQGAFGIARRRSS